MSIYLVQQSQNLSWNWCELFDDGNGFVVKSRSPQEYPSEQECLLSLKAAGALSDAQIVTLPYVY